MKRKVSFVLLAGRISLYSFSWRKLNYFIQRYVDSFPRRQTVAIFPLLTRQRDCAESEPGQYIQVTTAREKVSDSRACNTSELPSGGKKAHGRWRIAPRRLQFIIWALENTRAKSNHYSSAARCRDEPGAR